MRLAVLHGLRRSELLAVRWAGIDFTERSIRIDRGLVATDIGAVWTEGKTARSSRSIPIDPDTAAARQQHRSTQLKVRLAAGPLWEAHDLLVATRHGRPVIPRHFNHTLDYIISTATASTVGLQDCGR